LTSLQPRNFRVVVCGTTFGQVYLEALRAAASPFRLAGILARGSDRSRACAEFYGVPLFTTVEQLPGDIAVACVVVRSSLLGGRGTELAQSLMARGVHVLQEHPLHHDELSACLRQSRQQGVQYRLNPFYPHLPTVRQFVSAARELFRRRRPLYIDAACSFQVAYALLDILRAALGKVSPWRFAAVCPTEAPPGDGESPFRILEGVFAGVPLTMRIQNQLPPDDPDNYAHLLHRITFGTEAGDLTLVTTHGPAVWSARPQIPREVSDPRARSLFAQAAPPDRDTATRLFGRGDQPSQRMLFRSEWPEAVRHALAQLGSAINGGQDPLRLGQHQLTLCRVWQEIAAALGPPQLMRYDSPPRPLSAEDLAALGVAWSEPEE
jgi:pyochelin biosynthesis protein PchG